MRPVFGVSDEALYAERERAERMLAVDTARPPAVRARVWLQREALTNECLRDAAVGLDPWQEAAQRGVMP